jgi:hypothetical protein
MAILNLYISLCFGLNNFEQFLWGTDFLGTVGDLLGIRSIPGPSKLTLSRTKKKKEKKICMVLSFWNIPSLFT